jgi:hypothetical protein
MSTLFGMCRFPDTSILRAPSNEADLLDCRPMPSTLSHLECYPAAPHELEEFIGRHRPRMIAAYAAGCAPIVRAFERGERASEPRAHAATIASGLRVPKRLVLFNTGSGCKYPEAWQGAPAV